jgi:lauroyl/myristoyl acyltransferase
VTDLRHLLAWTPLQLLYVYADVLFILVYCVLRWRLTLARRNLAGAFPELSPEERETILRRSYRQMARTLMETSQASRFGLRPTRLAAQRMTYTTWWDAAQRARSPAPKPDASGGRSTVLRAHLGAAERV